MVFGRLPESGQSDYLSPNRSFLTGVVRRGLLIIQSAEQSELSIDNQFFISQIVLVLFYLIQVFVELWA